MPTLSVRSIAFVIPFDSFLYSRLLFHIICTTIEVEGTATSAVITRCQSCFDVLIQYHHS